jgi:hypothetical protein
VLILSSAINEIDPVAVKEGTLVISGVRGRLSEDCFFSNSDIKEVSLEGHGAHQKPFPRWELSISFAKSACQPTRCIMQ